MSGELHSFAVQYRLDLVNLQRLSFKRKNIENGKSERKSEVSTACLTDDGPRELNKKKLYFKSRRVLIIFLFSYKSYQEKVVFCSKYQITHSESCVHNHIISLNIFSKKSCIIIPNLKSYIPFSNDDNNKH